MKIWFVSAFTLLAALTSGCVAAGPGDGTTAEPPPPAAAPEALSEECLQSCQDQYYECDDGCDYSFEPVECRCNCGNEAGLCYYLQCHDKYRVAKLCPVGY
jgi:hypothetical protein